MSRLTTAVDHFIEVFDRWDGDAFEGLMCVEAEAIADIARAVDANELADKIIQLHAKGDDDEDDQHHDLYDPEES